MTWYVMYQWKKSESIYNFMLKEKRLGGLCAGIIGKEIFFPMLLFKHLFLPKCGIGDLHDPLICVLFAKLSTQNLPKESVPYLPPICLGFWTYPLSKMSIVMAWRGAAKHSVMAAASFLPVAGQHRLSTRIAYCYYCILGLFPCWLGVEVPEG